MIVHISRHQREWVIGLWLALIATVLSAVWWFRDVLTVDNFADWINAHFLLASLIYTVLLSFRGLFLVPSTPLLLAGIVVFPSGWVWSLNMIGILTSSAIVYLMVRFVGFDFMVREKYRQQAERLHDVMERRGLPIIILWSCFPLVPTDAIIYAAATLRMTLYKCLLGVAIGEGILITLYVTTGRGVMGWLQMVPLTQT